MSLRRLTLANLVANVGIVITGGAVRLTGSGLGCPTWPKCTEDSYTANSALGIHGAVEFGNRLLTFVLVTIAIWTVVAAWRTPLRGLAVGVAVGIPGQGVVGGLTVWSNLNPYVVGLHFLLSMGMIAAAHALWRRSMIGGTSPVSPHRWRALDLVVLAASGVVIVLGVIVTGSGPHAGDEKAVRTGLDPVFIAQLHADAVFLLLGLVIATWLATRTRSSLLLLGVILAQGIVGFVQYFTSLPEILVGMHMAGACAVWIAALNLLYADRVTSVLPGQSTKQPEMVTVS